MIRVSEIRTPELPPASSDICHFSHIPNTNSHPKVSLVEIIYKRDVLLDTKEIIRVFEASGINRPIQDKTRIAQMFANSNLVLSAWDDKTLVGVCRCLTDFNYACYLSDLAVDKQYQSMGVGKRLVKEIQDIIGERVALILLSAPIAMDYYPKIGFETIQNGFIIKRKR